MGAVHGQHGARALALDAHACAAMAKYRKCQLVEARDVARECGLPRAVQAAGGDNKAGINVGNGIAVDAGVRAHSSVWAPQHATIARGPQ